jgi:hypothetical protein
MRRRSALLCTHVEGLAYLKGWRTRALCEGSAGDTAALHCLRRIRLQQFAPALQTMRALALLLGGRPPFLSSFKSTAQRAIDPVLLWL